jgi:hypothetical protein
MGLSKKQWNKFIRPVNFSNIEGSPQESHFEIWRKHAPIFHGRKQDFEMFIGLFFECIGSVNLIHEDEIMTMFSLSLTKYAWHWYYSLLASSMYSFHGLISSFLESWVGKKMMILVMLLFVS